MHQKGWRSCGRECKLPLYFSVAAAYNGSRLQTRGGPTDEMTNWRASKFDRHPIVVAFRLRRCLDVRCSGPAKRVRLCKQAVRAFRPDSGVSHVF